MRMWLLTIGVVCLLLIPFAGVSPGEALAPDPGSSPPVAQPLVREGDFAVKLAAELGLGTPLDETTAEDMLVKAGITPANGWISNYPMTPQIIGQLQESIARSASSGNLTLTADQANKRLSTLTARLNLPMPAGAAPSDSTAPLAQQAAPADVNSYYSDNGMPIVTYYPPPAPYAYYYDWVPYPVWWYGSWFPGFYMCFDFTTVVAVRARGVAVVSDHFVDHHTGQTVWIDAHGRNNNRGETVLRTDRGDRFRNISDMRAGRPLAGNFPVNRRYQADRGGRTFEGGRDMRSGGPPVRIRPDGEDGPRGAQRPSQYQYYTHHQPAQFGQGSRPYYSPPQGRPMLNEGRPPMLSSPGYGNGGPAEQGYRRFGHYGEQGIGNNWQGRQEQGGQFFGNGNGCRGRC